MLHVRLEGKAAAVLMFVAALAPPRAHACSCVQVPPRQALDEHDAVFEGRVVALRDEGAERIAELEVVQHWKGMERERAEVRTASMPSACGVELAVDTSWLIYADDEGGVLRTSLCSRTRRIEEASDDLVALGAGVVPVEIGAADEVEAPPAAPPRAGCASCAIDAPTDAPIGASWLACAALALLARRRRRRREAQPPFGSEPKRAESALADRLSSS